VHWINDDWLKIGILHHPLTGKEMIANPDILQSLADHNFQIFLHGHIHESIQEYHIRRDRINRVNIIGAGTFGAPTNGQVPGIPLQYNLLRFDPTIHRITVETRKKEKPDGAWSADSRWVDDPKKDPAPRYFIYLNQTR